MFWRKDPWLGRVLPSQPEFRLTKLLGRTKLCSVYLAERVNQPVGDSLTIKIYARDRERHSNQPEIEYLATSEGICLDRCLNAEVDDGSYLLVGLDLPNSYRSPTCSLALHKMSLQSPAS